ncbi:MAG: hypothetical protein FD152_2153 [Xanthobacteraceae bacterium]|nr:MAG: hypothetical protein FD152_2153 [Xanthobacteraceae bacterium]
MITSAAFMIVMLVGVPIGLCLCLAGIVYILASGNPLLFQSYPLQMFGGVDSYGLIAIPLFILIGEIMNGGGITKRIVDLHSRQHVRRLHSRLGHGAGRDHVADHGPGDGEAGL